METLVKNNDDSIHYGKIISVRGSVVDIWFENDLPSVYTIIHVGRSKEIVIEVLA